jgi:hypothetical protein
MKTETTNFGVLTGENSMSVFQVASYSRFLKFSNGTWCNMLPMPDLSLKIPHKKKPGYSEIILKLCVTYILHKWKFITLFAQKAASSPIPNPRHLINCYSKGPKYHRTKVFLSRPLME